ncbi:MAG: hypothetical protein ACOYOK_05805 [Pseudobdellovibrionaceae bacterium]
MKTFTFIYDPEATPKNTLALMKKAIKTGMPYIEKNQLRSPSLKALISLATENRLEIFKKILNDKPSSIYELAQSLGKDLSYVSKEVRVLESTGIIALKKAEHLGRDKIQPVALYDRIVFDFDMALKKAANHF